MVFFNYATKEITAKIVYYGPGLSGKTTNLQSIYQNLPADDKGKMITLATSDDRTLFFDFLPLELGTIRGMRTRIQLYTVPGQVFYNTTRKLVLKGADGVVFVADSQNEMMDHNVESFDNLIKNLKEHGMNLKGMPHILQFNKRDLPNIVSPEELNKRLNQYNVDYFEAIAVKGVGVYETLREVIRLVINKIAKEYGEKQIPTTAEIPIKAAAAKQKIPTMTPASEIKEKIPSKVAAQQKEVAMEPSIEFNPEKEGELMSSPEASDEDFDENWINELEAEDLKPGTEAEKPPFIQDFEEQKAGIDIKKEESKIFSQSVEFELPEEENLPEEKPSIKELNVPLEIAIDKKSKNVTLKINLNIKIKRE